MIQNDTYLIVDESGFDLRHIDQDDLKDVFLRFLDIVMYAQNSGPKLRHWSELYCVQVTESLDLTEVLYSRQSPLDNDIGRLLGLAFDKMDTWDEEFEDPPAMSVRAGSVVCEIAPSLALVSEMLRDGQRAACLTTGSSFGSGEQHVTPVHPEAETWAIHLISVPDEGTAYWRHLAGAASVTEEQLDELCSLMYPALVFAPGIWRQCSSFEGHFRDLKKPLLHNLAGLNDHAPALWAETSVPAEIQRRMSATASVDCSPESPLTRGNRAAMREREVGFGDVVVVCEWHAKLERHRNRIHFAVKGDRVLVGLFTAHLST